MIKKSVYQCLGCKAKFEGLALTNDQKEMVCPSCSGKRINVIEETEIDDYGCSGCTGCSGCG
jgi:DNA-directed RNA polymerase subunit RPC12/RpoP